MEYKITPKYYEELNIGDKFITPSRTITETDIVTYAGLSGDYNPVHTDEEYAKKTQFGTRLAHGPLTTAIALGQMFRLGLLDANSMALLSLDTKYTAPVVAGDTIHCIVEVINMRPTKKPDRGILTVKISVYNQRNELVVEAIQTEMHRRRPQ